MAYQNTLVDGFADNFVDVASIDQLPPGKRLDVVVNYVGLLIFNLDGKLCAIEDVCTHDGGPLGEGEVIIGEPSKVDGSGSFQVSSQVSCQIECPRHGARFEICSGAVMRGPAFQPAPTYAVQVVNDRIFVEKPK